MPLRLPLRLAALALLYAGAAHATQVLPLDLPELVRSSSDIVIGRVESTRSHWNEARTRIVTDVVVRVNDALKGERASTVTLVQPGGEVDGVRLTIEGSPVFRAGEDAMLFLWRDARGQAQVNGLAQGKFAIQRDPTTGRAWLERSLAGLSFVGGRPAGRAGAGVLDRRPALDEFTRLVRRELASPSGPALEGGRR